MRRQGVTEAIKVELKEATDFYHEAIDSMLGTGLFDIEGTGEFAGKTLSAEYRALLTRHQQLMGQWVDALGSYQAQQSAYEVSADELRQQLVAIEESGDATVEDQVAQLNGIISQIRTLLLGGLLLSLIMVTLCGFWLTRKLVTPLLQVDKRMQDIAAGEGDLNARINLQRDDEIGSLANSVDRFIEKLQKMISSTMDNNQHISEHVHTSVNRVEAISQSSRQTAEPCAGPAPRQ